MAFLRQSQRAAGMTLVEMLLALAVGMVVCYAAFLAFRTTSQTVRLLMRLGLENRLLREGFIRGMEELDYWTAYDDPLDAGHQGLRRTTPLTRDWVATGGAAPSAPLQSWYNQVPAGLAFTPLAGYPRPNLDGFPAADLAPAASDPQLYRPADFVAPRVFALDRQRGWDGTRPYQANDPRRWWRGNLSEWLDSDLHFGRYAAFAGLYRSPRLGFGTWTGQTGLDRNDASQWRLKAPTATGPYGQVDDTAFSPNSGDRMPYTWLPNQMLLLHDAMGNYGLVEYLPSNAILSFHGGDAQDGSGVLVEAPERRNQWLLAATGWNGLFRLIDGGAMNLGWKRWGAVRTPTPLACSMYRCIPLMPLSPYTGQPVVGEATSSLNDLVSAVDNGTGTNAGLSATTFASHARSSWPGATSQIYDLQGVINRTLRIEPLLPIRPTDWPDMQFITFRAMVDGRFINQVRVRWIDPTSGEISEIAFNGIGSSLRGARQQRRPGGGWARWYGSGDTRNDATLDSMP